MTGPQRQTWDAWDRTEDNGGCASPGGDFKGVGGGVGVQETPGSRLSSSAMKLVRMPLVMMTNLGVGNREQGTGNRGRRRYGRRLPINTLICSVNQSARLRTCRMPGNLPPSRQAMVRGCRDIHGWMVSRPPHPNHRVS